MKRAHFVAALSTAAILAAAGATAFSLAPGWARRTADADPRLEAPFVQTAEAAVVGASNRGFTGSIGARVQSNLGFRVPGKIIERLVDVGQEVKLGQPLMRIDENDLRLALTAKRNAAAAARAVLVQATADEKRYSALIQTGFATHQRYEQAKAALDTATAQVAAAEAEAGVAENELTYTTLTADVDGTVVETLAEPGQVVAAGQTVTKLAHAGPREAIVALPENMRPAIGSIAQASIYGAGQTWLARLRQLSDAADPQTRTYEARYVLEGQAAAAPLGATVTIRVTNSDNVPEVTVPAGAIFDDGTKVGVWVLDEASAVVHFRTVAIRRLGEDNALVSGVRAGEKVVSLGAHLLHEGAIVRTTIAQAGSAK